MLKLYLFVGGGFGSVTLCENYLDKSQYAIKIILPPEKDARWSTNETIQREAAILAKLQHKHVVRYFGVTSFLILYFCSSYFILILFSMPIVLVRESRLPIRKCGGAN